MIKTMGKKPKTKINLLVFLVHFCIVKNYPKYNYAFIYCCKLSNKRISIFIYFQAIVQNNQKPSHFY